MNTISVLALNMGLNNRGIFGASIKDTYENVYGLDVIFKYPTEKHCWGLVEEISEEEACKLTERAIKMPRRRMAVRATFIK